MKKATFFVLLLIGVCVRGFSQSYYCGGQHWNRTISTVVELEKVLINFKWANLDTLYCDSGITNERLDYKWYVGFYNKQLGNYFSNSKHICFARYYFQEKGDSTESEIHIVKFILPQKDIDLFKAKYGSVSKKAKNYRIAELAYYQFVVKKDNIYFISTQSYRNQKKGDSIFNRLFSFIAAS